MGTWYYQKNANESMAEFIARNEFTGEGIEVAGSAIKLKEAYFALRHKPTGRVFAVVVLIDYTNDQIGLKVMDEDMGPYYHDMPKRLFDLLTPTEIPFAIQWRESVKQVLAKKDQFADIVGKDLQIGSKVYHVRRKVGRCYEATRNGLTYKVRPRDLKRASICNV